jgi:hypothetical protein
LDSWGECGSESESWSTNHCNESIVENSVATQDIETYNHSLLV